MTNPWMLGPICLDFIRRILPPGSIILELGSGEGTGILAERYTLFSVEHTQGWLDRYDSHYIYAPIRDGWYCPHLLKAQLPKRYDLLLVDGPPGEYRLNFLHHLSLFDLSVHLVFDDVNRTAELAVAQAVAHLTKRPYQLYGELDGRQFAHIPYVESPGILPH